MRWLKKWLYLVVLLGTGMIYLVFVDHWQVYAGPLRKAARWCEAAGVGGDGFIGTWLASLGGEDRDDLGEFTDATGRTDMPQIPGEPDGTEGGNLPGEGPDDIGQTGPEGDGMAGEDTGSPGDGEVPAEPVFVTVEDDYFADALFIGDSRTVGLFKYGGLEETATFYASTGLTVYRMFDSKIVSVPGGKEQITVEEALRQNSFSKIYLMIGINEMGIGTADSFLAKYYEAVVHLQELQPDAVIYLQAIMKVTDQRSSQGDYITNAGIDVRNVGIEALADNRKTFYLDVNPVMCDETGGLNPLYTFDGVHLKAKYYELWKEYLKTHAISS